MITASIEINSSKEKIWSLVTDIENAKDRIECIKSTEILEKPTSGLVGLKWRETREMFGKEATETMWIVAASDTSYTTEAINCGCKYHSTVSIEELSPNKIKVQMSFKATPISFFGYLASPMTLIMGGMIKKAFKKDLEDIKKIAEA